MNARMLSQSEFIEFTRKTNAELYHLFSHWTPKESLIFRGWVDKATQEYSRHNKFDEVQQQAIVKTNRINLWLWDVYKKVEWPRLLKREPGLLKLTKRKAKERLKIGFQAWIKTYND